RGARGALWVALPFVVPPFLLVTAVAALYAHYQGLSQVEGVFFGVGPAVMAIIAISAYKLARSTNKQDVLLWSIAAIVCASTVVSGSEIVWLFLAAGLFGAVYYGGGLPRLRGSAANVAPWPLATVKGFVWLAAGGSLGTLGLFFAKASALTFGSGLAVVPFLHQGLVTDHHWLTERQLTDAVAMGLISPGPVVIMGTFAGYLVAGVAGAVVATVALFTPTYLFVVVPGRLFRRFERHPRCGRSDRRRRDRDRPSDDPRLALGRDRRRRTRPATAETDQGARAGARRRCSDRRTRTPLRGEENDHEVGYTRTTEDRPDR